MTAVAGGRTAAYRRFVKDMQLLGWIELALFFVVPPLVMLFFSWKNRNDE